MLQAAATTAPAAPPEVKLCCLSSFLTSTVHRWLDERLSCTLPALQAPPKPPPVQTEGVQAVPLSQSVTMLRGVCNERLKFEIEYGLKRGTTDNSYIVRVRPVALLLSPSWPMPALNASDQPCRPLCRRAASAS